MLLLLSMSSAVAQNSISVNVCVPGSGEPGRAEEALLEEIQDQRGSRLRVLEFPAEHAANFALNRLNAMTAAIVCDISDEQCIMQAAAFVREFTRAGSRIVLQSKVRAGDRDFMGQISRIKRAKPDVVYASLHGVECALFARQAVDMGVNVPLIAGEAARVQELVEFGGKAIVLTFVPVNAIDFLKGSARRCTADTAR